MLFQERLVRLSQPVKQFWGKHFTIWPEPLTDNAGTNLKEVFFSPRMAAFDDDTLFMALAHEWGHRMISPRSDAIHNKILEHVKQQLAVNDKQAISYVAPAIELLVDRANCNITPWADAYQRPFVELFSHFLLESKPKKPPQKSKARPNELSFYHDLVFALRLRNVSNDPLPASIHYQTGNTEQLLDCLFGKEINFYDSDDRDHLLRIENFSRQLHKIIPSIPYLNYLPSDLIEAILKRNACDDAMPGENYRTLTNIIQSPKNISHSEMMSDNTSFHSKIDAQSYSKRLSRQVIQFLNRQTNSTQTLTDTWLPGDRIERLDMRASFRFSPRLIPGLTTRKKIVRPFKKQTMTEKYKHMCLIVDNSISMDGLPALFTRSICQGINAYCRQKKYPLGLIGFSEDVDFSLPPGNQYKKIVQLLSKIHGNHYGTALTPPLMYLESFSDSDKKINHALIISDAEASDWADCDAILKNLLSKMTLTILLINTHIPPELEHVMITHKHQIRICQIDPHSVDNQEIKEIFK